MTAPIVISGGQTINSLTLSDVLSKKLVDKGETGMGFQDVQLTMKDGGKVDGIVLNGSILETVIPVRESDISDVRVRSAKEIGRHSPPIG
jgi:hypothetical protein